MSGVRDDRRKQLDIMLEQVDIMLEQVDIMRGQVDIKIMVSGAKNHAKTDRRRFSILKIDHADGWEQTKDSKKK